MLNMKTYIGVNISGPFSVPILFSFQHQTAWAEWMAENGPEKQFTALASCEPVCFQGAL